MIARIRKLHGRRRVFIDAIGDARCRADITLPDHSGAQCGRRRVDGAYCAQHARAMNTGPLPVEEQARIIRRHYRLARPVTPAEVHAEVANIKRRRAAGSLDDSYALLAAALRLL